MLSRKHYRVIAQAIKENTHTIDNRTNTSTMGLINELRDIFYEDNINFDKRKFVIACLK